MPDEKQRIFLLGFEVDGPGQLVVARNNPDDARYVVVIIPGVGSGISDAGIRGERVEDLYRKLADNPEDDSLSIINWLGYFAPQTATQAREARFAVEGAYGLIQELVGIRVRSEYGESGDEPKRVVVVAHGYGGLVAGIAARDYGLPVDALVFLGCAGVGVESVDELRVDGPVYAGASDVGADGTPFGVHGARPDSPSFGARILQGGPLSFRNDPVARYRPTLRRIVRGDV